MYAGVGLGTVAWMDKDPTIVNFQVAVNQELSKRGYKTIGTDGQLGPATCGAWSWLGSLADASWADNPNLQILSQILGDDYSLCKAYSNPVKVGSTTPWTPSQITQTSQGTPYLWGVADPRVTELQNSLNQQLDGMGYNKIPVTGTLDAATCGAMKFAKETWGFDDLTQFGANCQTYTLPTKKAPVPVATKPPAGGGTAVATRPKTTGTSQAWMVGGIVGAAVLAGLYAAKKRKG